MTKQTTFSATHFSLAFHPLPFSLGKILLSIFCIIISTPILEFFILHIKFFTAPHLLLLCPNSHASTPPPLSTLFSSHSLLTWVMSIFSHSLQTFEWIVFKTSIDLLVSLSFLKTHLYPIAFPPD